MSESTSTMELLAMESLALESLAPATLMPVCEPKPKRAQRKVPRNRSNRRGSLILDRRFFGVGRIVRATGTNDPKTYRAYSDMCSRCYEAGRHDVLEAIRDGRLTLAEAYAEYRWHQNPADLPGARELIPLRVAVSTWLVNLECSDAHARNLRQAMARLLGPDPEQAAPATAGDCGHATWDDEALEAEERAVAPKKDRRKIKELVAVANKHRDRCKQEGTPTLWNRDRAACLAFLRDQVGQHHKLWNEIKALKPLKTRPQEEQHRNPQSPEQLQALVAALGPVYGPMALSMALTGMDISNYFNRRWEARDGYIWIGRSKRNARKRLVPLIATPTVPTRSPKSFRRALEKYNENRPPEERVTPRDLRRTYARGMLLAEIVEANRRAYMGHKASSQTGVYERHDLPNAEKLRSLLADGETLHAYWQVALVAPTPTAAGSAIGGAPMP